MITFQQAFDRNWEHFVVQKQPRSVDHGICLYRGPNGAKCGIGLLIPDELYESSFPRIRALFEEPDSKFWGMLQNTHDSARGGDDQHEENLRRLAQTFNLTVPNVPV